MQDKSMLDSPPMILVVDDIIDNIEVLSLMLEVENYQVCIATNGPQALHVAEANLPDLILLDVMMPNMDGFTVCEHLKSNPKTAHIPVIFATAKDDVTDLLKGFSVGGVDYINKPLLQLELLTRVKTQLSVSQSQQFLERSRKQYEHTLHTIQDAIILLDSELKLTLLNAAAEAMLHVTATTVQGTLLWDLMTLSHNNTALSLEEACLQAIEKKQDYSLPKPILLINSEQKSFLVQINLTPLLNEYNENSGVVLCIHDITDAEKLNHALQQENKMRSLGTLSANIAHELRNPLASMVQSSQNICRRLEPSLAQNQEIADELGITIEKIFDYAKKRKILDFLEGINETGRNVASIIATLLQITRTSKHPKKLQDIPSILRHCIEESKKKQNPKHITMDNIELTVNFPENIPPIECNEQEIQQAFAEMIHNATYALHHAKTPSPKLTISVEFTSNFVSTTFCDNGPGMSAETLEHAFDPFYSGYSFGETLGLGLTVAYSLIVYNHNGDLAITSTSGSGTTIKVSLPIQQPTSLC